MDVKKPNQSTLSSPDVASLSGSIASEDRLDSDLEADVQQAGLLINLNAFDAEHFSVASSEGIYDLNTISETHSRNTVNEPSVRPAAFFRKALLSGVSGQLKNASDKVDLGTPTCLSFRKYLVIGTTKGIIFGFNLQQVLRFCLTAPDSDGQPDNVQNAVTTLSQSADGVRLLSGYQNGRIALWRLSTRTISAEAHEVSTLQGNLVPYTDHESCDPGVPDEDADGIVSSLQRNSQSNRSSSTRPVSPSHTPLAHRLSAKIRLVGKNTDTSACQLMHVIDDAHGVGHAITLANFTTVSSLAVAVDTGGSVFALNFRLGITGSRKDSVCFFSGSRGEICALDALGSTTLSDVMDEELVTATTSGRVPDSGVRASKLLRSYALVAMASFTKLIVAQLRPRLQISHWQPLKGPTSCLPLLAWMWSHNSRVTSNNGVEHALLAFGRGSTFQVVQVTVCGPCLTSVDPSRSASPNSENGRSLLLQFRPLYAFELDYEMISLNWISTNQIVVLDMMETAHLLDSSTGEDVETADLSGVQLCYSSYMYKSAVGGGYVSEALAYASQRACSQSFAIHGSQMLILGLTGVHLLALRTWTDITRSLFARGLVDMALFYCNRDLEHAYVKQSAGSLRLPPPVQSAAQFKAPSIPRTNRPFAALRTEVQTMLRDLYCPLLRNQSSLGQNVNPSESSESTPSVGFLTIALSVRIACFLDRACEFLVRCIYEPLAHDPRFRSWLFASFYEILFSPLAPLGQLNTTRLGVPGSCEADGLGVALAYSLPPNVVMDWIGWCLTSDYQTDRAEWSRSSGFPSDGRAWVEQTLLGLPPQCIDLNESVRLCWDHQLFKAYLHLYTDILFDFETPFHHLVDHLMQNAVGDNANDSRTLTSTSTTDLISYGQTLLLLLRNALAGESYSQQPLPSPMDVDVPSHIFNLLLNEAILDKPRRRPLERQPKYPRLWLVLTYCATDFLNLLILSIGSDRFFADGDLGLSHRVHLYNKLIACALEEHWPPTPDLDSNTDSHTGRFAIPVFTFLVHQLTQTQTVPVRFDDAKLFQLFEHICLDLEHSPNGISSTAAFESSVIDLIEAGRFDQLDGCLSLAERAKLYSVTERIHQREGRPVDALGSELARLEHLSRSRSSADSVLEQCATMIFAFLDHIFPLSESSLAGKNFGLSTDEVERVRSLVLAKLPFLVNWDAEHILRLVHQMFHLPLPELLLKLFPWFPIGQERESTVERIPLEQRTACVQLLSAYYRVRQLVTDSQNAHVDLDARRSHSANMIPPNISKWLVFLTQYHPAVAEVYIQLLAASGTGPTNQRILQFLEQNTEYRAESVLQFLARSDFPRECAYLYEKQGQLDCASDIYEQFFLTCWHRLISLVVGQSNNGSDPTILDLDAIDSVRSTVRTSADLWFALSQRRSTPTADDAASAEDCEKIWYHVIDVLLHEEQASKNELLESDINDLFHSLLSYLPRTISLTSIVSYILQSATKETTIRFSPQTSALLTRLVATCHVEVDQMRLNCEMSKCELAAKQSLLLTRMQHGFTAAPNSGFVCGLCDSSLRLPSQIDHGNRVPHHYSHSNGDLATANSIVAFRCGHMFHAHCLSITGATEMDPDKAMTLLGFCRRWICSLCDPCPVRVHRSHQLSGHGSLSRSEMQSIQQPTAERPYLSWYDPIQIDSRQISRNPFD